MNNLVAAAIVVVLIVALFVVVRYRANNSKLDQIISDLCRAWGVPDIPFNIQAAVREVMAGRRSGISEGEWCVMSGIEVVGQPSRTRLVHELPAPDKAAVDRHINDLFAEFGGTARIPPHLPEGRFVGSMSEIHPDIVHARITGHLRPIGGWLVAVPPQLVGHADPKRQTNQVSSKPAPSYRRGNGPSPAARTFFTLHDYETEVLERRRPGLPRDGRYWVALIEINDDDNDVNGFKLMFEVAATFDEAKEFTVEMERDYGTEPMRIMAFYEDEVSGWWTAKDSRGEYAILMIFHPTQLRDLFW